MNEKHKGKTETELEIDKDEVLAEALAGAEGVDASEADAGELGTDELGVDGLALDELALDELKTAAAEIADLKDKLLRNHAEMDNLRKRTQREVADAHKYGIEKFAVALLDVVDNLERALEASDGNEEGLRDGVQLTLDSWHNMMEKFNVERIDAVGEAFDPHQHEALSQMSNEAPEGTVIAQHVAGYKLHGRLIRAAKVLVSAGMPEAKK